MVDYSNKTTDPLYHTVGHTRYQNAIEVATPKLRKLLEESTGEEPLFIVNGDVVEAHNSRAIDIADSIMDFCTTFNFKAKDHFAYVLLATHYREAGLTLMV